MDNIKDNRYYIKKIVTDLAFILEHTESLTQDELEDNEILVDFSGIDENGQYYGDCISVNIDDIKKIEE